MARTLPTTDIFSFQTPVVKGSEVCVPVMIHGGWAAIRMPRNMAYNLADALLAAGPLRTRKGGDVFAAIRKPGGHLL